MRFKEIILERLTEWEWLPKAVNTAVDHALAGGPPASSQQLILDTLWYLNKDPGMIQFKATLTKPLTVGALPATTSGMQAQAAKIESSKLIDRVKGFWNVQYQAWQVGVVLTDQGMDEQALRHWIEEALGHELSHIKQFESEVKAGHVPPGELKMLGYTLQNVANTVTGKPTINIRNPNTASTSLLKNSNALKSVLGLSAEEVETMIYRLNMLEFDAWAYSLGSGLRHQYGEQAPAALNELMKKVPQQGIDAFGPYRSIEILGKPLDKTAYVSAVELWDVMGYADAMGQLKVPRATLWQKFMKETSRYTVAQAADKLAAKAALKRVAAMSEQQLAASLAKRLPELALKGALKSIPYAGAVIGVAFAINSLIQGDVLGAGLELAGGLGSVATAIPATSYQAAREMYSDYYTDEGGRKVIVETDAVQDPEGTKQRIAFLYNKIYTELKAKFTEGSQRLTGAQGAANARNAVRTMDTPGNPSPALHPELYPQQESLAHILRLAII